MPDTEKRLTDTGDEINLLNLLVVVLKRKKLILGITFVCTLVTAVVSLVMTPIYRAETRILPPQQLGPTIAAHVVSQGVEIENSNDIYIGMLRSRTVYDRIIDRFDLMKLPKVTSRYKARQRLKKATSIVDGKNRMIVVAVDDRDPVRAADMANAFIEELKGITQTLAVTEASRRKIFFEEQLEKTRENLIESEEAMRRFQEETGGVSVEEQATAVIETIAELGARIASKEVEFKVKKTYLTSKHPDYQRADEELRSMKDELRKLEIKSGNNTDTLMPIASIPKIGTDYARKLRELKYHENLYELMAKQYEMARVEEAKDATIIQILDKALPPERRAKPKRTFMVAAAAFISFFFAIVLAFLVEFAVMASSDPRNKESVEMIRRYAFPWKR